MSEFSSIPEKNDYHLSRGVGVWILLGSLLINFFLLGLVIAPVLHHPLPPHFGPPNGGMIEHLSRGLPPDDDKILHDVFQQEKPNFDTGRHDMEAALNRLAEAVQKPTVDPQELQKAFADIAAAHAKFDTVMNRLITQVVTRFSPEGRRIFARNGMHPPEHDHEHDDRMPPPPPPEEGFRGEPGHGPGDGKDGFVPPPRD